MKLNINHATFEAPTASWLVKSFWEYNDAVVPAEWQEVFIDIEPYADLLDNEEEMIDLLKLIEANKNTYEACVSVEW
jgi:hypothetical protein